ncbi:chaperonin 10-like protein [Boletus reticuloceps]|uniref:Chaperonin 10-like protein n=1 Tax=Boletus reticuloceps TaxID=495285 RepID=A0A8I2YI00_9AGAM|nr:chaperonin 10-like protein [Boletus reticuloceps]
MDVNIQKSGFFEIKGYPVILGEEGAGVVLKVSDGVRNLARGDNVFVPSICLTRGVRYACAEHVHLRRLFQATFGNKYGSFQEHCLVLAEIAAKIPPNLSYEEAASILIAFAPFAVATYAQRPQGIGLTPPFEEGGRDKYAGRPIVIFGGAASVGQQAIQLAKLSGFSPIITTASLHNEDLLLSLGATHILDRKLPNAALIKRVRELVVAPRGTSLTRCLSKTPSKAATPFWRPGVP